MFFQNETNFVVVIMITYSKLTKFIQVLQLEFDNISIQWVNGCETSTDNYLSYSSHTNWET